MVRRPRATPPPGRSVSAVTALVAVALVVAGAGGARGPKGLPATGILHLGVSLGGLRIGETPRQVLAAWGPAQRVCPRRECKGPDKVWFYTYSVGEPLGAAVRFDSTGHLTAVFTLGSPPGWRTAEGLLIGQEVAAAVQLYGNLELSACVGYGALSVRTARTVSSIYTTGEAVYGFALTAVGEPVCQ
jgi:hypothetical protein